MNTGTKFTALSREYILYFDNRAFRHAEKAMGHSFSSMNDGISSLTLLLQAGLSRHHPDMTLKDVDDIIDDIGYEMITEILGEAMEASPPLRKRMPPV
ncbi:MAG: hypothetical protein DDT38_01339 [Firmicutes bacterium]|nr:hypothetical protein [candidate division NPL-UPA2 bacterium]